MTFSILRKARAAQPASYKTFLSLVFKVATHSIKELIEWINKDSIDLKPYYQRNDIWTKGDQQSLIDTIISGYPLPNFFTYLRRGRLEMVDGQQRARTIYRFYQGAITNSLKQSINEVDQATFLNYPLCFTEILEASNNREIEEFYVLVNKKGKHLTTPEIHKAEFSYTNFLKLVENLLGFQALIDLDLFTEAAEKRMSDRNFVEELVVYLIAGIQDKKNVIEQIYKKDIEAEQASQLEAQFKKIIGRIADLNEIHPIASTRYKQRNDFYTLFGFISDAINESKSLLKHQYDLLILLQDHISPSQSDCDPLREYALNCVSQSNSKKAREARIEFFNKILRNNEKNISNNAVLAQVADFVERNKLFAFDFIEIEGITLMVRKG